MQIQTGGDQHQREEKRGHKERRRAPGKDDSDVFDLNVKKVFNEKPKKGEEELDENASPRTATLSISICGKQWRCMRAG